MPVTRKTSWRRDVLVRSRTCFTLYSSLDVTVTCAFPMARLSGRDTCQDEDRTMVNLLPCLKHGTPETTAFSRLSRAGRKTRLSAYCRAGAVLMACCSVSR